LRGVWVTPCGFESHPGQNRDMFYYVYILRSLATQKIYIGFTRNLKNRFTTHNKGLSDYTSRQSPWRLIYAEAYINKEDALKREKFLKSGRGRETLQKQLENTFRM